MPKMSISELDAFFAEQFPESGSRFRFKIESVEENAAQVRLIYQNMHLRPGGTISGPALMTLADMAMYVVVLGTIGPVALAVTTNLNINFLRKPAPKDVVARARLLKLGARLAVGEIEMASDGETEPVAHATVTYFDPAAITHWRTKGPLITRASDRNRSFVIALEDSQAQVPKSGPIIGIIGSAGNHLDHWMLLRS